LPYRVAQYKIQTAGSEDSVYDQISLIAAEVGLKVVQPTTTKLRDETTVDCVMRFNIK
jgi:hypothetical protein